MRIEVKLGFLFYAVLFLIKGSVLLYGFGTPGVTCSRDNGRVQCFTVVE